MNGTDLLLTLGALTTGDIHPLSNLANAAALLWERIPDINWAGFYLLDHGQLWLGPFAGKPACTCIALDQGVCGAAMRQNDTIVVPDVHAFPGHIACDQASRAEIVIPIRKNGSPIGVLDIDSATPDRFSGEDAALLERVVHLLESNCRLEGLAYDLLPHA